MGGGGAGRRLSVGPRDVPGPGARKGPARLPDADRPASTDRRVLTHRIPRVRALSEPSRLAAAVFLLLVVATIGAFFAAQRLKHQDPLLRYRASDRAFSPNGDGIKDTARIRFRLPEA